MVGVAVLLEKKLLVVADESEALPSLIFILLVRVLGNFQVSIERIMKKTDFFARRSYVCKLTFERLFQGYD